VKIAAGLVDDQRGAEGIPKIRPGAEFLVMCTTGGLLFSASAASAYGNLAFRIKLSAIVLAGVNALVFHLITERTIAQWDATPEPPLAARLAGLTSIVLWVSIVVAGRMMSYTLY